MIDWLTCLSAIIMQKAIHSPLKDIHLTFRELNFNKIKLCSARNIMRHHDIWSRKPPFSAPCVCTSPHVPAMLGTRIVTWQRHQRNAGSVHRAGLFCSTCRATRLLIASLLAWQEGFTLHLSLFGCVCALIPLSNELTSFVCFVFFFFLTLCVLDFLCVQI